MSRRMSGSPHPIDLFVGGRVRARRQVVGMTQETLAKNLDVSFQQVQKYERGANRISASRLVQIAITLDTPISSFFDGVAELDGLAPDGGASLQTLNVILGEAQGGDLIEAFLYIRSGIVRRKIVDLVREISISQA